MPSNSSNQIYDWKSGNSYSLNGPTGYNYFTSISCDKDYIIGVLQNNNLIYYFKTTDYSYVGSVGTRADAYMVSLSGDIIVSVESQNYSLSYIESIKFR